MHALRAMSGGHVFRVGTADLDWQSVPSEVKKGRRDGVQYVNM